MLENAFSSIYNMQNYKIFCLSGLIIVVLQVKLKQVNFYLTIFHDTTLKSYFEPWLRQGAQWNSLNEVYLLSKFDISSFSMTKDFQTGNFDDFEQFKIDSHFAVFGQVIINPNCLSLLTLGRSQSFYILLFGQNVRSQKTIQTLTVWQKIQETGIGSSTSHFQLFSQQ